MPDEIYRDFLAGDDTLRVYRGKKLVFASKKDRLLPLIEFIDANPAGQKPVIIYDKIMGNAAALLSVLAGAREVYSPLGSEHAIETLKKRGIVYHIAQVVPCIRRDDRPGLCPMEQLSLGKAPGEFYREITTRI